jgi:hypothetical protein
MAVSLLGERLSSRRGEAASLDRQAISAFPARESIQIDLRPPWNECPV